MCCTIIQVEFAEQQFREPRFTRSYYDVPQDPLFHEQWHLVCCTNTTKGSWTDVLQAFVK